jgi:hypothetical protein
MIYDSSRRTLIEFHHRGLSTTYISTGLALVQSITAARRTHLGDHRLREAGPMCIMSILEVTICQTVGRKETVRLLILLSEVGVESNLSTQCLSGLLPI